MKAFRAVFLALLATFFASGANAATKTWTGGSSSFSPNWSDANNWNPAGIPASGDVVIFPTGAAVLTSNCDYVVALASITFQQGGFIVNVSAPGVGLMSNGGVSMSGVNGNSGISGTLIPLDNAALDAAGGGTL